MSFDLTSKITIIGMSGSGKTTLSRFIQKAYPRLVIFDRMHEYEVAKSDLNSCEVTDWRSFEKAVRWSLGRSRFRIVIHLDPRAGKDDVFFESALWALYARRDVCVVIEEVWNFANRHAMPRALKELYLTGRHRRIGVITTSQRPAEIHKTIIAMSQHVMCFQTFERNDVQYLAESIGQAAFELPNLKKYHYLHFQPGKGAAIRPPVGIRTKLNSLTQEISST